MTFKSEAQRRFMYANHPKLAKEFEDATPKGAKLPDRVGSKDVAHHGHQHLDGHAKKHLKDAGHPDY